MKTQSLALAIALMALHAHADAGALASSASPRLTLEVFSLDANGNKASGWKADLSGTGATEWTWADGAWGTGQSLGQDAFFQVDATTGNWGMSQDWSWSKAGWFNLDLNHQLVGGNLDPYLNYAMAVKNSSGGTLIYSQTVTAPISPTITGASRVAASVSGGLTDLTRDGVTLAPAQNGGYPEDGDAVPEMQLFLLSTDGVAWRNAGVDVGLTETHANAPYAYNYGVYSDGFGPNVSGPTGTWNWMQLRTRFSLTGNGDTASINGYAEIIPSALPVAAIPEADTYALLALGMGLVGALARRRAA